MNWTIFKLQTQRSGSFQLIFLQPRHQTNPQESSEQYWNVGLNANEKTVPQYEGNYGPWSEFSEKKRAVI